MSKYSSELLSKSEYTKTILELSSPNICGNIYSLTLILNAHLCLSRPVLHQENLSVFKFSVTKNTKFMMYSLLPSAFSAAAGQMGLAGSFLEPLLVRSPSNTTTVAEVRSDINNLMYLGEFSK